jgi:hypothetical protein
MLGLTTCVLCALALSLCRAADSDIQRVLSALERHQLDKDTLVLITSDNGPWNVGPLPPLLLSLSLRVEA